MSDMSGHDTSSAAFEECRSMTKKLYEVLDSKKAEDIKVIDIGQISVIADYFIIANAGNQHQMQALMDAVDEMMYKNGIQAKQVEGNKGSTWVLMDYGDIIVHLFSRDDRLFYDLERIWQDGTEINPEEL